MSYLQILNILKDVAYAQPNINTVCREFLDLNREDTEYSAVVIQDRDGSRDIVNHQDYMTYSWHIGYVDRLVDDESNRDHIFSTGINVINNIINTIRQRFSPMMEISTVDKYITFNQRFTANCAGVYIAVFINIPISDCEDVMDDAFGKLEKTITSNGTYEYSTNETPWDSVMINVNVSGGGQKPEEHLVESISSNGDFFFRPDLGKVYSDASIAVDVHPSVSLNETYTANGSYPISGEFAGGNVTVSVPQPTYRDLEERITSNGEYVYGPDGYQVDFFNDVRITVSVPQPTYRDLEETITSNGEYMYGPDGYQVDFFNDVRITVSVPQQKPETTLSREITSNGSYTYTPDPGEVFNSVAINVSVPSDAKPETTFYKDVHAETYFQEISVTPPSGQVYSSGTIRVYPVYVNSIADTITSNGSYHYDPRPGDDYINYADISVNVHPSTSLVESITSNGTYNFTGEWQNASIAVSVPEKQEITLVETITTNNTEEHYWPPTGYVYSGAEIEVRIPEESVVETITSNGSYHYDPAQQDALINSVDISVDVHPSTSLVESITSNGTYNFTGEWQNATIAVSVPGGVTPTGTINISSNGSYDVTSYASAVVSVPSTQTVTVTQRQYNSMSVHDSNTIYLIYN